MLKNTNSCFQKAPYKPLIIKHIKEYKVNLPYENKIKKLLLIDKIKYISGLNSCSVLNFTIPTTNLGFVSPFQFSL